MNSLSSLVENFHFLRPFWLLGLLLVAALFVKLNRSARASTAWRGVIEPELLEHLIVSPRTRRRLRPHHTLVACLALAVLAVSGPSWKPVPSPFVQNRAPVVIVFEMTKSMEATDVPPSRMERARQKVGDLIARNISSQIALVVYSGSAHIAVPFTNDSALLNLHLEQLTPDLMPVAGDEPSQALALAASLLNENDLPGTIIFVTDGVDAQMGSDFADLLADTGTNTIFYAFGTDAGDDEEHPAIDLHGLDTVATAVSGSVLRSTIEPNDLDRLQRSITSHLENSSLPGQAVEWQDAGYFLLWPIMLLMLFVARRGWSIRWQS